MCMGFAFIYVYMCIPSAWRPEEVVGTPGTGVADSAS